MILRFFAIIVLVLIFHPSANCQIWSKVGTGIQQESSGVYCLHSYNNELYVGGGFVNVGTLTVNRIARWNGNNWFALNNGLYGLSYSLTSYLDKVYVGGTFNSADGNWLIVNIGCWDGSNWSQVGVGSPSSQVKAMAVYNGSLYIGGPGQIGNLIVYYIARWDGNQWYGVGGGIIGGVPSAGPQCLAVYKGKLIVGGRFEGVNNDSPMYAQNIASWDGSQWASLGQGLDGRVFALVVDTVADMLYAGGVFYNANNTIPCKFIARWDGTNWHSLGNQTDNYHGINGYIQALEIYNNKLFATGANGPSQLDTGISCWDGAHWKPILGIPFGAYALEVFQNKLYVGGDFTQVGSDTSINYIVSYLDTTPPGNLGVSINKTTPQNDWYLGNNIPNPFKNTTAIPYRIPPGERGEIKVFGYNGALKKIFPINASNDTLEITTTGWQQGTYLYSLYIKGELKETKKMVVR